MNRRDFLKKTAAIPAVAILPVIEVASPTGGSLQSALDKAKMLGGGVVRLGVGDFDITEPLVMNGHEGTVVVGSGGSMNYGGTKIQWRGDPNGNVWEISDCRNCLFSDFSVVSASWHAASAAFFVSNIASLPGATTPTSNIFERVMVQGTNGGIGYGWRFASEVDANNDMTSWYNCEVSNYTKVGWSFEHSQSKVHLFVGCRAYGNLGEAGVATNRGASGHGGSFHWYGGFMHGNGVADFDLGTPNDAILVSGLNSEHSARLLQTNGPTGAPWPLKFEAVRWESAYPAADGRIVNCLTPGPLHITGCQFRTYTPTILYAGTWAAYGSYTIDNCVLDMATDTPVNIATSGAQVAILRNVAFFNGQYSNLSNPVA